MDIYLNGTYQNGSVNRQVTVGQYLAALRQEDRDRLVVGLRFDGQAVASGELDSLRAAPLTAPGRLELEIESARALAARILGQVAGLLDQSRCHHEAVARLLAAGKSGKAMELLTACFTVWNAAEDSLQKASRLVALDLNRAEPGEPAPAERIAQLGQCLRQLKQHLQARDFVAVADLVEYELPELTSQWQAMLTSLQHEILAGAAAS